MRVAFRRRREGKTDYRRRRKLLKQTRLVLRCSLSHTKAQLTTAHLAGDRILTEANSKELNKYGWKAPCGNIPAAYLTGFMVGLKAKKKGFETAILDIGVKKPVAGSRIYAGLRGVLDAGLEVPVSDKVLAEESRIRGEHIVNYWKSLEDAELRQRRFSKYLKENLSPEELPKHVEEVKAAIEKVLV